jgi:hypothetical protein
MFWAYRNFCLVGIGWTKEQITQLQDNEIDLDQLQINLQFSIKFEDLFTITLTEERRKPALGFYLLLLTVPNTSGWETFRVPMTYDHAAFNWITTSYNDKHNEEFQQTLESSISAIYQKSFVHKYFNTDVRVDNGIVHFFNNSKRQIMKNDRVSVFLKIPDKSKTYFKHPNFWETNFGTESPDWIPTEKLSQVSNGTLSHNFPSTKSHLYTPPFSISFRSQGIDHNYFSFSKFNSPNLEENILTMLMYDNDTNALVPFFDPYLIIPYHDQLALNQTLEFKVLDSSKKQVVISDNSQLFVILTLM